MTGLLTCIAIGTFAIVAAIAESEPPSDKRLTGNKRHSRRRR